MVLVRSETQGEATTKVIEEGGQAMEKTTGDSVHDHIRARPKARTLRKGTDYPFRGGPTRHHKLEDRNY